MSHKIHDGTDREMTDDEIKELEATRAEMAAQAAAIKAAEKAKASALAKLEALGLTEAEVKALVG